MPYQRRNNRRNDRNQNRRPRKPREDPIVKKAKKMFYKPFTFQEYFEGMKTNPRLYSTLMLMKLKVGFIPSQEEIDYIFKTNREGIESVREFFVRNQIVSQIDNPSSGYI